MSEPTYNAPLLNKVMDHIEAHPELHQQQTWFSNYYPSNDPANCQTAACFAGWTALLTDTVQVRDDGLYVDLTYQGVAVYSLPELAMALLGLDRNEAQYLFQGDRTREELRAKVDEWTAVANGGVPDAAEVLDRLTKMETVTAIYSQGAPASVISAGSWTVTTAMVEAPAAEAPADEAPVADVEPDAIPDDLSQWPVEYTEASWLGLVNA